MIHLSDIFLGDFPIGEYFAANPEVWNARYGLQGCPGLIFKMPSLTPILAGAPGYVLETGFDSAGKGKFIVLVHDGFQTVYAHLNDILVAANEQVVAGQLIAHSNQSGLCEYPCLLFEVAPCDKAGTRIEHNGYGGTIDPLNDNFVEWNIKGLKEPATKQETAEKIEIDAREYAAITAQATNLKVILNFLKKETTFEDYVKEIGETPVDLTSNPNDGTVGQKVNGYLESIADEIDKYEKEEPEIKEELPLAKEESFLSKLWHGITKHIIQYNAVV